MYVTSSLDEGFIAQVLVSRDQRMVGFECRAEWLDQANSPEYVTPKQQYWSYNPSIEISVWFKLLLAVMWLSWGVQFLHEVLNSYSEMANCDALEFWDKRGAEWVRFSGVLMNRWMDGWMDERVDVAE